MSLEHTLAQETPLSPYEAATTTRYAEVSAQIRSLTAEKESLRKDIEAQMRDGVVFTNGYQALTFDTPRETVSFDWKTALMNGDISKEVADRYIKRTMSQSIRVKALPQVGAAEDVVSSRIQAVADELMRGVDVGASGEAGGAA